MLTLKQEIDQIRNEIHLRENSVDVLKKHLRELEDARAYCQHEWDSGMKGWEHEGRNCIKCGINDQYAPTLLKMVEHKN